MVVSLCCAIVFAIVLSRVILVFLNLSVLDVPFSYESIIATLCESLDTLDEPEAKVFVIDYKTWLCIIAYVYIAYPLCSSLLTYCSFVGINDLDNW